MLFCRDKVPPGLHVEFANISLHFSLLLCGGAPSVACLTAEEWVSLAAQVVHKEPCSFMAGALSTVRIYTIVILPLYIFASKDVQIIFTC